MVLHCDEDELAVIALGEPASPEDDSHLQQCPRCRSRLDQLAAVVASARSITDADRPVAPPAEIWDAIERDLGRAPAAEVVPLASAHGRRTRPWVLAAAAAVVGLLAGSVVTAALVSDQPAPAEVVARATLEPIGDAAVTGTATIERGASGEVLRVDVGDLPPVPDGYYEVWMATPDASTMVAIGTLNPGAGTTFTLPAGMAVTDYPLVDVSVEHFDGDAGHSAVSVVRGQLGA